MYITRTTKLRKGLVRVFFDGGTSIDVTVEAVLRRGLRAGADIPEEDLPAILAEDEKVQAMENAWRLLGFSSRSEKELADRLKMKKFSKEAVDTVSKRLSELGYMNDERYARDHANLLAGKNKGSELIRFELLRKGIAKDIVADTMANLAGEAGDEISRAKKAAAAKLKTLKNDDPKTAARKLMSFLAGRGFSIETVRRALKELKASAAEEDF